jgi:hypothetical protein
MKASFTGLLCAERRVSGVELGEFDDIASADLVRGLGPDPDPDSSTESPMSLPDVGTDIYSTTRWALRLVTTEGRDVGLPCFTTQGWAKACRAVRRWYWSRAVSFWTRSRASGLTRVHCLSDRKSSPRRLLALSSSMVRAAKGEVPVRLQMRGRANYRRQRMIPQLYMSALRQ